MADAQERIVVNAAIEKLIKGEDRDEAARTVIKFGHTLKTRSFLTLEGQRRGGSGHDTVTGHTPEYGNVTIRDESEEPGVISFGIHKERIGYFRIQKCAEGVLQFHHFWKSGVTTQAIDEDRPETYYLGYDIETLAPSYFGVERKRIILSLGPFQLVQKYLEILFGKKRFSTVSFGLRFPLP